MVFFTDNMGILWKSVDNKQNLFIYIINDNKQEIEAERK